MILSSSLSSLVIETDKDIVKVTLNNEMGESLFSEEYYVYDGKVNVFDIGSIIESDIKMKGECIASYTIAVEWFNRSIVTGSPSDPLNYQSDSVFFKAFFCEASLPGIPDLAGWITKKFITTVDSRRIPPEFSFQVYFFSDKKETDSYEVNCMYRIKDSDEVNKFVTHGYPAKFSDNLFYIDLSDKIIFQWFLTAKLPIDNLQIISFSVECGDRYLSFHVDQSLTNGQTFFFRNIFNAWDFVTFPAQTSEKTDVERSLANIGPESVFYDKTVSKTYEVQSGPVNRDEVDLISQLIASHEVLRICNDVSFSVLITDSDCSLNDGQELQSVKFNWRYADNRPPFMLSDRTRIFTKEYNKVFS